MAKVGELGSHQLTRKPCPVIRVHRSTREPLTSGLLPGKPFNEERCDAWPKISGRPPGNDNASIVVRRVNVFSVAK